MSKKYVEVVADDLDGTISPDVKTIEFGYRGREYEIELNRLNAKKLDDALAPFIRVAHPIQRAGRRRTRIERTRTELAPTGPSKTATRAAAGTGVTAQITTTEVPTTETASTTNSASTANGVNGGKGVQRVRGGGGEQGRQQNRRIREWAASQGIEVYPRGTIKKDIVDAYHAAHPARPGKTAGPATPAFQTADNSSR